MATRTGTNIGILTGRREQYYKEVSFPNLTLSRSFSRTDLIMCALKNISDRVVFFFLFLALSFFVVPFSLFAAIQIDDSFYLRTLGPDPLLESLPNLSNNRSLVVQRDGFNIRTLITRERQIMNHPALSQKEIGEVTYDFPVVQNHSVDRQIVLLQTAFREQTAKGLLRISRYFTMIHEILEELNLPKDLVFLPLIESNFSVNAVSSAKATGPWQFMKGTARRYGLRIDPWIDERRDPVKSTRAAATYLKDLYGLFDSWPFSLASYNAGENRVGRAIIKTKATDFWELRASGVLPRETQNYVPKFMAATIIAKNPALYGFSLIDYELPLRYDEVKIERQTSLHLIAHVTDTSLDEIKAFNPELRKETTPPNYPNYLLKLPHGKKEIFMANLSKIKNPYKHKIKWGETVGSIARKYNVPVKQLREANQLRKNSSIRAGSLLIIPPM